MVTILKTLNKPFDKILVPLKYFGNETGVTSLMLEFRRYQYMDELNIAIDIDIERINLIKRMLIEIISLN